MPQIITPIDFMRTSVQFVSLVAEAQSVMLYRMMGMSGFVSLTQTEKRRMLEEKPPAFAASMVAGTLAIMAGKAPTTVMEVSMAPLRRETRSNRRRLAKRHGLRR